jgi:hypothetical protein
MHLVREGNGNGHVHKMEDDRLLSEYPRALSYATVRAEDAAVPTRNIHHDPQDSGNEGVASPHGSLDKSESAELQKERTSVPHSPSRKQIHVRRIILAYFFGRPHYFVIIIILRLSEAACFSQ